MIEPNPDTLYAQRAAVAAAETEALLDRLLSAEPQQGEQLRPDRLVSAMRHASLAGGKRLRPFLLIETAAMLAVPHARALMAGAALECVHCYSLAHDDLPVMDNDDLRRGRPTVHRAFDEATAILAGDALLTFAFGILARTEVHPSATVRIALVAELARAAGVGGMAGGQMLDLAAEGRFGDVKTASESDVVTLQTMKTGALIRFACRAGAILGEADAADCNALDRFGTAIGQAYPIADDLLDLEGDAATLGKATGKDAAHGKATLVALHGAETARARLAALAAEAEAALERFAERAAILKFAARFVVARQT